MSNLLDQLQGQLSDDLIQQLSRQLGGASREQTMTAANGAITALFAQIAQNASTPQGASSLASALDRDHDGSVLNNIMDLLGGRGSQQTQNRALNGAGILKHVMGERQNGAIDMISQLSGLDKNSSGNLMATLAPIVMGMLGKQKREQGLDAGALASMLTGELKQQRTAQSKNPTMAMITRFLDANNDGSIVDDVAKMGMRLLGNMFKKK
jgi:hypothetical protein